MKPTAASQNTRPTTAARCRASRGAGARLSRRASRTPVNVEGTDDASSWSRSIRHASSDPPGMMTPSSMSILISSSTKKGLPSARRVMSSTSESGRSDTCCRTSATNARLVSSSNGVSRSNWHVPSPDSTAGRSSSSVGRVAIKISVAESSRRSARSSRRLNESASAQWRSSITMSTRSSLASDRRNPARWAVHADANPGDPWIRRTASVRDRSKPNQ